MKIEEFYDLRIGQVIYKEKLAERITMLSHNQNKHFVMAVKFKSCSVTQYNWESIMYKTSLTPPKIDWLYDPIKLLKYLTGGLSVVANWSGYTDNNGIDRRPVYLISMDSLVFKSNAGDYQNVNQNMIIDELVKKGFILCRDFKKDSVY